MSSTTTKSNHHLKDLRMHGLQELAKAKLYIKAKRTHLTSNWTNFSEDAVLVIKHVKKHAINLFLKSSQEIIQQTLYNFSHILKSKYMRILGVEPQG